MSDPFNSFASSFDTIDWKGKKAFVNDINKLIEEYNIGTLVIGVPESLAGTDTKKTKEIKELIEFFKVSFPEDINIETEDEAMTSAEAKDILRQMGVRPSKHRRRIDMIAAQRILTSFMGN